MEKSTRIRYKLTDGKYVSTQSFLGNNGVLLTVDLVPQSSDGLVSVSVTSSGEVVDTKTVPSLAKGKAVAKLMLKSLGVNFLEEVRNRSNVTV